LLKAEKVPIVCGGSGLYIHALAHGFFDADIPKNDLREMRQQLYRELEHNGIENLLEELRKSDPEAAARMTAHTPRRIIRSLEIYRLTGVPISELHKKRDKPNFKPMIFGIHRERKTLYERINARVDRMFEEGLIEEARRLRQMGYHWQKQNSLNTVGIKEVFQYLDAEQTYDRMRELIKQNTRRFAKRQMSWFRKEKGIHWIGTEENSFPEPAAIKIFQMLHKAESESL
jgi:tRNA dimethylallyltransferase